MKEETRAAIARIDILENQGTVNRGTGFLINKGIVLTALHVVANRNSSPPEFYQGTISLRFPKHSTNGRVIKDCWDQAGDWVLLKCEVAPPVKAIPLASFNQDQCKWETWGFPQEDGLTLSGEVQSLLEDWKGLGIGVFELLGNQVSAGKGGLIEGWSGSPVMVNGKAVGILRSALMNMEGRSEYGTIYATDIAEVVSRCPDHLPPLQATDRIQIFVNEYRHRLEGIQPRWDLNGLGGLHMGSTAGQKSLLLDDMYLPLRFGSSYDLTNLGRGQTLTPQSLMKRSQPLVIKGLAGIGKTTWIRWTYHKLLRKKEAFPVLVELRKLARSWSLPTVVGKNRSLEWYLKDSLGEIGLADFEHELVTILKDPPEGLTPVFLVDGWDELGRLGEELREKLLAFIKSNRKVVVVVTSRPYGNGRPTHSEDFQELDIQPLSDDDVKTFATHYFQGTHGKGSESPGKLVKIFLRELDRSPEAKNLARTPLLLTMMLTVSCSGGLPDRRNKLYYQCVENLLATLPDQKEEEGAVMAYGQFRPSNERERFNVIAELAFKLQNIGYQWVPAVGSEDLSSHQGATVIKSWEEMEKLLPRDWGSKRRGFLAWLTDRAGLLTSRADGTLNFIHLSFQEFLAAWHLNETVKHEKDRQESYKSRMHDTKWWETLRLWAAILGEEDPAELDPILLMLIDLNQTSFWLAGTMLAEGLGRDKVADIWVRKITGMLNEGWDQAAELCAVAWAAGSQTERRQWIASKIEHDAPRFSWMARPRCERWVEESSLGIQLPKADLTTNTGRMINLREKIDLQGPHEIALFRVLFSSGDDITRGPLKEFPLLRLWPSHRPLAGERLQSFATLPVSREEVLAVARNILKPTLWDDATREFARNCADDMARHLQPDMASEWARYLAQNWTRYSPHIWACNLALALAHGWGEGWKSAGPGAAGFRSRWHKFICFGLDKDWAREIARDWAVQLGVDKNNSTIATQFGCLELSAFGQMSSRAFNFYPRQRGGVSDLVAAACQLSMHPDANDKRLEKTLEQYPESGEPLWPALCRSLARQSQPGDRALLEELARHPEQRSGTLHWALKYFVRGDIVLNDGTDITLDELCDELNLDHLAYVEDMPEELNVG